MKKISSPTGRRWIGSSDIFMLSSMQTPMLAATPKPRAIKISSKFSAKIVRYSSFLSARRPSKTINLFMHADFHIDCEHHADEGKQDEQNSQGEAYEREGLIKSGHRLRFLQMIRDCYVIFI